MYLLMWVRVDSESVFLKPLSVISSERSLMILFIFSESFEYLPKSLISNITMKTSIGNITSDVMV